jgi:periplasmic divalent cation tolerance protein
VAQRSRAVEPRLIVVLTTAGNADDAARIARALVERKLVACVNIVPQIRSIYRWKDELQDDAEVLLISKTLEDRFEAVAAAIRELHGYEVPEIVALPADRVDLPYATWVRESV